MKPVLREKHPFQQQRKGTEQQSTGSLPEASAQRQESFINTDSAIVMSEQ